MSLKIKKYLVFLLAVLVLLLTYWYFFSRKWVVAIGEDVHWEYRFVNEPSAADQSDWLSRNDLLTLNDEQKSQHLVLQQHIVLNDPESVSEAEVQYSYKYAAQVYINGVLCSDLDEHLISPTTEKDNPAKIEIIEHWRPRIVRIGQPALQKALRKGDNVVQIIVRSLENIKDIRTDHHVLLLLEKGSKNSFPPYFKFSKPNKVFSSSKLPIFKINTYGKSIPDEPKTEAYLEISSENDELNLLKTTTRELNIKMERRGHIAQSFAKKSYTFNTYDQNKKKLKTQLLDLPESSKWVLYGPYADKSLIRNALTYSLYAQMGNYAPRFCFIDLVINTNYQGIYMLTEKIQVGSDHLNLNPLQWDNNDSTKMSGGYLLEIDRNEWQAPYPVKSDSIAHPLYYGVYHPKRKKLKPLIEQKIRDQYFEFEHHLYNKDSIYDYVDLNSFVDYLIITEVTKNIDGYRLSTFLYNPDINAAKPKFYIGPIWDYNFAFGLSSTKNGYDPEGFVYDMDRYIPFWWHTLVNDPIFNKKLTERYTQLRKSTLSDKYIMNQIDSLSAICQPSVRYNFSKWTVLGSSDLWPNYFLGKTYEEEIDYLKNWTEKRLHFLDRQFLRSEEKESE
ncbi:MAG: CotH kinase family protein [Flavobacteriales bacterium]|nr:CotH kinase family protein [Flavobacteriales bacterium]